MIEERGRRFLWTEDDVTFDGPDVVKYSDSQPRDDHGRWTTGGVPPEPGTSPLEPGMIRGYHYTNSVDSLHSILEMGLSTAYARGHTYEEPDQLWFSATKPSADTKAFIEVHVKPDEMNIGGPWAGEKWNQQQADDFMARGSNFTLLATELPPDRIVTYSEPWHDHYRYIMANYPPEKATADTMAEMESVGKYDPDYRQAVDLWLTHVKAEKFSESQPRVPAGSPEGGEWTDGRDYSSPEYAPFIGGLTAADFPGGRVPGIVGQYHDWKYPENNPNEWFPREPPKGMPRFSLEWTPEQQAQARAALAEVVRTQEPTTRMPMTAFKAFLADGVLRNQWETGRTGAATGASREYVPKRAAAEASLMGIPEGAAPADKPVYGYFAPAGQGDFLHADAEGLAKAVDYLPLSNKETLAAFRTNPDDYFLAIAPSKDNAGEGQFVSVDTRADFEKRLRNSIDGWDRSNGRHDPGGGDSWLRSLYGPGHTQIYPLGDGNGGLNVRNIVGYANNEYAANSYGDVQVTLKRSVLDTSTVTGGDSIDGRLMGVPARMVEAEDPRVPIGMAAFRASGYNDGRAGNYVEVQYREHPTLDDVRQVTFTAAKPTVAVQQQLAAAGIEWVYDPMLKMDRQSKVTFTDVTGHAL